VVQGFANAYAGITLPNPASVGLHLAMGYVPTGTFHRVGYKFGRWHDVMSLERALMMHAGEPPVPTPLPEIENTAELRRALETGEAMVRLT
jgi:hypothetical protein